MQTLLAVSASLAVAQYQEGPAPPRLNIPGAVPLPVLRAQGAPAQAYRSGPVLVRTRRPLKGRLQNPPAPLASSAPAPTPRAEFDAKPVTEEIEEPIDFQGPFVPSVGSSRSAPQLLSLPQPPPAHRAPQPKLLPQSKFFEPNPLGEDDGQVVARFQPQERPAAAPAHKVLRPTPPSYRAVDQDEPQHRQQARPTPRYNEREKKPVAQILRKYREEHEDGTITWGFENDDGSFKEETIGIDCVTRWVLGC